MSAIVRKGDVNSAGGAITSIPQSTFYVNGSLATVNGSIGTGHPPCPDPAIHCSGAWSTVNTQTTFQIEGILANRIGDTDTCGHPRVDGSPDFFIN